MIKPDSEIEIKLYEPQMKAQVAQLFELEYKVSGIEFEKFMSRLYEHSFQIEKCIRIVAVDHEKVVGFQSFFYWPYTFEGKIYNSYQSGNSLVHPNYRGKRLFARMLNYISENNIGDNIDFLVGFPVQQSFNSFIKNGWENLFNLQWHIKTINPFAFLFSHTNLKKHFPIIKSSENNKTKSLIELSKEATFQNWKSQLVFEPESYFKFEFNKENVKVVFDLKFQKRKKIIHELIIGNVYFSEKNDLLIEEAFTELIKKVRESKCVTILSIAINKQLANPPLQAILNKLLFKEIDKNIFFIIKPLKSEVRISNPTIWNVGRADIDTW